jgi:flagellar M-ring protein FliF
VEKNLEQYDPENTTIRSEQVTEEKSVLRDSLPPSTRTNAVTNYEINKSIEHIVENVGNVKRLSVATIINDKLLTKQVNGEPVKDFKPRDPQEMDQLMQIVKRTVGFDSTRNDEISVVNIPFDDMASDNMVTENENVQQWDGIAVKVFLVLAMIAAVMIIRSLLNRMKFKVGDSDVTFGTYVSGELPEYSPGSNHIRLPAADAEIPLEVMMKSKRRNQISDFAKNKPDEASRLLKVWLADESQA